MMFGRIACHGCGFAAALLPLMAAGMAGAFTLDLPPAAVETGARSEALTSYNLPVGPWADGKVPSRTFEGKLTQTAWRIDTAPTSVGAVAGGMTTLQLLAPLRGQLLADGYHVIFECEAVDCGGFDFRYGTDILPEPEMHVDMGDFRFLAAERGSGNDRDVLSLVVSRNADSGFVQATRVEAAKIPLDRDGRPVVPVQADPEGQPGQPNLTLRLPPMPAPEAPTTRPSADGLVTAPVDPDESMAVAPQAPVTAPTLRPAPVTGVGVTGIGPAMEAQGAVPLEDLVFASGSADLAAGEYASLDDLAGWLLADPVREVVLVGHTDASGGFDGNMALSRRRADSVRAALLARGVPAGQVQAQGIGPLSPRATNLSPEGREQNRRVEAMLLAETP